MFASLGLALSSKINFPSHVAERPEMYGKIALSTTQPNKGMNRNKLQASVGAGGFASSCRLVYLAWICPIIPTLVRMKSLIGVLFLVLPSVFASDIEGSWYLNVKQFPQINTPGISPSCIWNFKNGELAISMFACQNNPEKESLLIHALYANYAVSGNQIYFSNIVSTKNAIPHEPTTPYQVSGNTLSLSFSSNIFPFKNLQLSKISTVNLTHTAN